LAFSAPPPVYLPTQSAAPLLPLPNSAVAPSAVPLLPLPNSAGAPSAVPLPTQPTPVAALPGATGYALHPQNAPFLLYTLIAPPHFPTAPLPGRSGPHCNGCGGRWCFFLSAKAEESWTHVRNGVTRLFQCTSEFRSLEANQLRAVFSAWGDYDPSTIPNLLVWHYAHSPGNQMPACLAALVYRLQRHRPIAALPPTSKPLAHWHADAEHVLFFKTRKRLRGTRHDGS
jgi:hypothetical protein